MKNDIYSQIQSNKWKTIYVMTGFTVLITFVIYFISSYFLPSESVWFITPVMFLTSGISAFLSYWYSDKLTLLGVGAKEATGPSFVELNHIVENLSIAAGIPKPPVYYMVDNSPNAFATGRDPNHAAICVTTGIIELLDRSELEGVIAHEISHIKNFDIRLMAVVSILIGVVISLIDYSFRFGMFKGTSREDDRRSNGLLAIVSLILIILAPIMAQLLKLAISRNREYLADASGAYLTRYPKGLADALVKISEYKQPVKAATDGNAHMFFDNPLKGKGLTNLFSTHPPAEERIKRLLAM